MPNRPLRGCATPGCPSKVERGRCETCRRPREQHRRQGNAGYSKVTWLRFRLDYLVRHPRCVLCGRLASTPDHWPRSRRQLIAAGIANPDQDRYVRALCTRCHSGQTAIHQPGGWAAKD